MDEKEKLTLIIEGRSYEDCIDKLNNKYPIRLASIFNVAESDLKKGTRISEIIITLFYSPRTVGNIEGDKGFFFSKRGDNYNQICTDLKKDFVYPIQQQDRMLVSIKVDYEISINFFLPREAREVHDKYLIILDGEGNELSSAFIDLEKKESVLETLIVMECDIKKNRNIIRYTYGLQCFDYIISLRSKQPESPKIWEEKLRQYSPFELINCKPFIAVKAEYHIPSLIIPKKSKTNQNT